MARPRYLFRRDIKDDPDSLPKNLSFLLLSNVKFYAIAEHTKNGRKQTRIEFLPGEVRKHVELINNASTYEKENQELKTELEDLSNKCFQQEEEIKTLKEEIAALQKLKDNYREESANLHKIIDSFQKPKHSPHPSMRSTLNDFDEKVSAPYPPYQGGAPGLGKK